MSWKGEAKKVYEDRVVRDALTRLSSSLDEIPFTPEELHTLARRARESFRGSERMKERFARYKAHLSRAYGEETVSTISSKLEEINNEIGYEEK